MRIRDSAIFKQHRDFPATHREYREKMRVSGVATSLAIASVVGLIVFTIQNQGKHLEEPELLAVVFSLMVAIGGFLVATSAWEKANGWMRAQEEPLRELAGELEMSMGEICSEDIERIREAAWALFCERGEDCKHFRDEVTRFAFSSQGEASYPRLDKVLSGAIEQETLSLAEKQLKICRLTVEFDLWGERDPIKREETQRMFA